MDRVSSSPYFIVHIDELKVLFGKVDLDLG